MDPTYPIQLKLTGRKCVIVGAGPVAARKADRLCQAGVAVHVVGLEFCPQLTDRSDITRHQTDYHPEILADAAVVFACTDKPDLNRQIADDARKQGIWCNVADDPDSGDFFVPAQFRSNRLQVNVSTDGASPQLAATIRDHLASEIGPEYAILAEELARARPIVQQRIKDQETRKNLFQTLCTDRSLSLLRNQDVQAWRDWLDRIIADRLNQGRNATDGPTD